LIYESEVESESVKGDLSSTAAAEVHGAIEGAGRGATEGAMLRRHRRRSAEAPQKAQCGDAIEAPQKAQCGDATEAPQIYTSEVAIPA